ncbi:unnamed protein product [Rotaria socialis]
MLECPSSCEICVEDFSNKISIIPMSSVPVQLLIYVIPRPTCFDAPLIMPLTGCLEVSVGMKKSFTLFFIDLCNPNISDVADITVSRPMAGMLISNMIYLPTNVSVVYITLTWTPQASQIGSLRQLCRIVYTG